MVLGCSKIGLMSNQTNATSNINSKFNCNRSQPISNINRPNSLKKSDSAVTKDIIEMKADNITNVKSSPSRLKPKIKNSLTIPKEKYSNSRNYKYSNQKVKFVSSKYKQAANDFGQRNVSNNKSGNLSSPSIYTNNHSGISLRKTEKVNPRKVTAKLHSTAIYNNTVFEDPQCDTPENFSTTVVGGPKRTSVMSISDISEITPTGSHHFFLEEPTPMKQAMTSNEEPEVKFPENFSEDDIELDYLEYLIWAHMDLDLKIKKEREEQAMKNQLVFLASLISKEEDNLLEKKKILALIQHHDKIGSKYDHLKNMLQILNESISSNKDSIECLSSNLESKLNEMKLENIYLPNDLMVYADDLKCLLKTNCELKQEINQSLELKHKTNCSIHTMFTAIEEATQVTEPCLLEVEKAASFSIQNTSLKLTFDTLTKETE